MTPALQQEIVLADPDLCECLSSSHRRRVLRLLAEAGGVMSFQTLANALARRELAPDDPRTVTDLVRELQIELYHNHLPELEDRGLIEIKLVELDPDDRLVSLASAD